MAIYIDLKCPTCRFSFTQGFKVKSSTKFNLGVPFVRCPSCNTVVKTGKKPWSQMTTGERASDKSALIGQAIVGVIKYAAIPIFLLILIYGEDWASQNVALISLPSLLVGVISSHILIWQKFWDAIQEIEDVCEREAWDELIIKL